nr:hypothetical protein [Moritella viscosa]SHO01205.1 unnamed protein product [Moritella viscosa]
MRDYIDLIKNTDTQALHEQSQIYRGYTDVSNKNTADTTAKSTTNINTPIDDRGVIGNSDAFTTSGKDLAARSFMSRSVEPVDMKDLGFFDGLDLLEQHDVIDLDTDESPTDHEMNLLGLEDTPEQIQSQQELNEQADHDFMDSLSDVVRCSNSMPNSTDRVSDIGYTEVKEPMYQNHDESYIKGTDPTPAQLIRDISGDDLDDLTALDLLQTLPQLSDELKQQLKH